jgi:hypothetical protein
MSGDSAQAKAAGEQAAWQSSLSSQLSGIALPELQKLTGNLTGMLSSRDASGMMAQDRTVRDQAAQQLNQSYGQARMGTQEQIGYNALRSGEGRSSPGAVQSALGSSATMLAQDQSAALRNLQFQSAQSSMADYNQVLSLLGQGSQSALGLAGGFSGAAGQAIGGLSNQSQTGSALGGAASGAALGATLGPWGALVGGVVGGAAGYFGGH